MTSPARIALIVAALFLPVSSGFAAPLCRGDKGQFTPCTKAELRAMPARRHVDDAAKPDDKTARSAEPGRLGPFRTAKLCRGDKGQFTPCPK